jgi:hypothetical protein
VRLRRSQAAVLLVATLLVGVAISQPLLATFAMVGQMIEAGSISQGVVLPGTSTAERFEANYLHFRTGEGVECIALFVPAGTRVQSPVGVSCNWE